MKKILIASALAVLIVAGYVVGQLQFADAESVSVDKAMPYANTREGSPAYSGSPSTQTISKTESLAETDIADPCIGTETCGVTPIGDPKGTKIVKSGSVEIKIDRNSVNDNYDKVVTLISDGGYVESSSSTRRVSTLTVRIPSDKLDSTLKELRKLGTITSESITSFDRSFEAVDYDARLKVLREREVVLNNQLKNAAASETAYIQEQIFNLHGQIESLVGQKNLLDSQVAMSTLTITLTEKGVKTEDPGEKSMLGKAWTTAVESLLTTAGGLLIVVAALLPLLILGGLVVVIIRTALSKKKIDKEV